MKNKKSFTLIELLIVIAIIGLISSIVSVNLKGTREKARIAGGLEFSSRIYHALGAEAVGIWSFDEGGGLTVHDRSGYGNHGTINGASFTPETPHQVVGTGEGKWALSFGGNDDYVEVPDSDSLDFTDEITIEAWIYPKEKSIGDFYYIIYKGIPALYFRPATEKLTFRVSDSEEGRNTSDTSIYLNYWYHIAVTFKNPDVIFYINGIADDPKEIPHNFVPNNTENLNISMSGMPNCFSGLIDEVRIYNKALTTAQIQKHYAEGLEKHQNLATVR